MLFAIFGLGPCEFVAITLTLVAFLVVAVVLIFLTRRDARMATITFKCEACGKELSAPVETIGKASRCACGKEVTVPGPVATATVSPADETTLAVGFLTFVRIVAWLICGIVTILSWMAWIQTTRQPGHIQNASDILSAIYITGIGFVAARAIDGVATAIIDRC